MEQATDYIEERQTIRNFLVSVGYQKLSTYASYYVRGNDRVNFGLHSVSFMNDSFSMHVYYADIRAIHNGFNESDKLFIDLKDATSFLVIK